ncbi:hypothetical protein BC831DRAFT_412581 [Entophlyctis helioformis]|nr:hypothetical protein BC831DRAFT_412581 [Entophlyctis helioformis]
MARERDQLPTSHGQASTAASATAAAVAAKEPKETKAQAAARGRAAVAELAGKVAPSAWDVCVPSDVYGSPWQTVEAHPAVFTGLAQRMGIQGIEVVELFSLDASDMQHLEPIHGLVFLFQWTDDDGGVHSKTQAAKPEAIPDNVFFINQVVPNACATQALLSIALNCPDIRVDAELAAFKEFGKDMSPAMRGLALSSSQKLRTAHNSFVRQTDHPTLHYPVPAKPRKRRRRDPDATHAPASASSSSSSSKKRGKQRGRAADDADADTDADADADADTASPQPDRQFHFIGYIPIDGHVWELDGLKRVPRRMGAVPPTEPWTSVVVPALQERMSSDSIEFSLMAVVRDGRLVVDALARSVGEAQTLLAHADRAVCVGDVLGGDDVLARVAEMAAVVAAAGVTITRDTSVGDAVAALDKVALAVQARQNEERDKHAEYETENVRRRFNYAPFVRKWIEILATKGDLPNMLK